MASHVCERGGGGGGEAGETGKLFLLRLNSSGKMADSSSKECRDFDGGL